MTGQVCNYLVRHLASVGLAVAPNGRSPSVSLQHQSMPGVNAADGWFNIVSVAFTGVNVLTLSYFQSKISSTEVPTETSLTPHFLEDF